MIYSKEVEEMCTVAQGVHHGCAPIPEEAKWVQAKKVEDISERCRLHSPLPFPDNGDPFSVFRTWFRPGS